MKEPRMKYRCDCCHDDLNLSSGITKFRLTLSSVQCPHDNTPTMDMYIYPPIERNYHFCNLACLSKWLEKKK